MNSKRPIKVLITGAAGYIGSYLTHHLSKKHTIKVVPLCRKLPRYFSKWRTKFDVLECDVTELKKLKKEIPQDIDVIIHLAAFNDVKTQQLPDEALIVNGIGTRNMLEIAREIGSKSFIYFSVLQVYGREMNGTFTIHSPVNCENDYAFTHYVAEGYCKMYSSIYGLNTNVIRLSYSFGCPISPKVNRWTIIPGCFCLSACKEGEITLKSSGKSNRDFIPLEYVTRSMEYLIRDRNRNRGFNIYNLTSENVFSVIEITKLVQSSAKSILGKKIELVIESEFPKKSNCFVAKNNLLGPMNRNKVWEMLSEEIKKTLRMLSGNEE